MRPLHLIFLCCMTALAACNNGGNTSDNEGTMTNAEAPRPKPQSHLSEAGTTKLINLLDKYYTLKNALVASNASLADSAATQLSRGAADLQAFLESDTAHNPIALKPYFDTIITHSQVLAAINDKSCEHQRLVFGAISSAFYELLKSAGLKNGHVYHEYCPMAFNEQGAYWLSGDREIKNPYFGKKMIECGEVTDSL